jgi:hypothetical protein
MSDDASDRTLPFGDAERLDALRSEFERASRSGSAPRIEDFLTLVEEALRPATFSELLKVEIALRLASQKTACHLGCGHSRLLPQGRGVS